MDNIEYQLVKDPDADSFTIRYIHNPEGYTNHTINMAAAYDPQYFYYRRDHLGNNREAWRASYRWGNIQYAATTTQRTQYYPSGLPWNEGLGSANQPYKYNGKEFIEMHGYDTYDYGARGLHPAKMRFDTMDPLCEKYYSISPYVYALNNPVRFVDLHGDSITTVINTTITNPDGTTSVQSSTYYYGKDANGNYGFLDGKGQLYSGGDQFVANLTTALTSLRSGAKGQELVDNLMNSTNIVQIGQTTGGQVNSADPNGTYILWDPNSTTGGPDQTGSTTRPAYIGLGHEMAHIQDIWNGTIDNSTWTTVGSDVISNAEKYATHIENQLRSEQGLSLRTHYSPGLNSTRILKKGTNASLFYKTIVTIKGISVPTTPFIY